MAMTKKEALILKAATLYYMSGFTQAQIAKKFGLSRPTIVRMLKQAVDEGYVEIRITKSLPHAVELETLIEAKYSSFGLNQVIVVDSDSEGPKQAVGRAVATYLEKNLSNSHVLGIGWSSTVSQVSKFLRTKVDGPSRIVQLGGYVSGAGPASAQEISVQMGNALGAPVEVIPAPVLVENTELCKALLREPSIANTMDWVAKCNIGIVGIGVATKQSALVKAGYIKANEIDAVHDDGAVGEVLSHYFDGNGSEIETPWFSRMISVDLATLRGIDNLIGVATGIDKAEATMGSLKAGMFNTLIIDAPLAQALVDS